MKGLNGPSVFERSSLITDSAVDIDMIACHGGMLTQTTSTVRVGVVDSIVRVAVADSIVCVAVADSIEVQVIFPNPTEGDGL